MINEAYEQSLSLLRKNATKHGFVASADSKQAQERNYVAIFGRDAMICAIGALASGDAQLIETGKKSIATLAEHMSSKGQIPFSVNPQKKQVRYWVPQSVDGTIWWLVAYWLYAQYLNDYTFKAFYNDQFRLAINWLEHRLSFGVLEQGQGADWADYMPRSGVVLYTNALWLLFLRLINASVKDEVYANFEFLLSKQPVVGAKQFSVSVEGSHYRSNLMAAIQPTAHFLTATSRVEYEDSFDCYGNILACMSGLVPKKQVQAIMKELLLVSKKSPFPIRVLEEPQKVPQGIFEQSHENKAWHYHNAGVWPYVGGFWVYLLAIQGKKTIAANELERLAKSLHVDDWSFYEYFHGRTGKPYGMKKQSWNAATYVIAYSALHRSWNIL